MAEVTNEQLEDHGKSARHILPKAGLVVISLLWIAYIAVTVFMISATYENSQAGVDPRLAHAVAQGAANVVPVLLCGGVVLGMLTMPLALLLRRRIKA